VRFAWWLRSYCQPSPLEQLGQSGPAIGPLRISLRKEENRKKTQNRGKIYYCGGAEESKGGDGDAAAAVAHAVKGGDGEEKGDVGAAAALPHAVAPVGAPSVYCCIGERYVYCCGGAEESKRGGWEEERDGDAIAALPHVLAPAGAPSVYSCGGAEERRGCDGDAAATFFARGGARGSAKRGGGGALR
jgi:hypothetical protein